MVASTASGAVTWPPPYMQYIIDWVKRGKPADNSTWGMWDANDPAISPSGAQQPGEGGVDLPVAIGTPVYALATGPVVGVGYWQDNAHGVLTQRVNVPGVGPEDLYYQHIQLDTSLHAGDIVQQGQKIGTIGPFNEIELGFNPAWGGPWGGQWGSPGNANPTANHPGPWVKDPRPWLAALVTGQPAPITSLDTSAAGSLLDFASIAPTVKQWGEYAAIFALALIMVLIGIYLLGGHPLGAVSNAVTAPVAYVSRRRAQLKGAA